MRRICTLLSVITLLACLAVPAVAESGVQNGDSLAIVNPAGGAYVIVTNLEPGDLDFNYGWNNAKQFATPALGYWIGVYDVTASHYEWVIAEQFIEPNPKMMKLQSLDTSSLTPGHEYLINFFIRDNYTNPVTNVVEVQLSFISP